MISVIVPAYNEEKNLPDTLKSIQLATNAFMQAEMGSVDLIVVNNGSTDNTEQTAKDFGARVVFEPHRQIARARNCGAKIAEGEILLFCDADTHLPADILLKISNLMSDTSWIGGGIKIIPDENNWINRIALFSWDIFSNFFQISGGTLFCRKDIFNEIGGFPEEFYIGEEVQLQFRMKMYAYKHQRKTALLPDVYAVTSMRKVREFGYFRYAWAVFRCVLYPPLATQKEYCSLWYDVRNRR